MPGRVISAFNFQVRMFPVANVFASFAHICEFISQMCSMELKKRKKKNDTKNYAKNGNGRLASLDFAKQIIT